MITKLLESPPGGVGANIPLTSFIFKHTVQKSRRNVGGNALGDLLISISLIYKLCVDSIIPQAI